MSRSVVNLIRCLQMVSSLAAIVMLVWATVARSEEAPDPGRVLPVPAPITADAVPRLREAISAATARVAPGKGVFKVVLDFNPDGHANASKDFGPCYELADYLRGLQGKGVRTIAYVHGDVTRHSVLPVLACTEIVFSHGAHLGEVVRDPGETLDAVKRLAYEEAARSRRVPVSAVVRKMFDRNLEVLKIGGRQGEGDRFVTREEAGAAEARPVPGLQAGTIGRYGFEQASAIGLCQPDPRETLADVAAAYRLGRESLEPDPLLGRTPVAWLLGVDGPVDAGMHERLQRRVKRALGANANLLIFQLRCHGGDGQSAVDIADYLENLNRDRPNNPVRTVAYVTEEASDTAAFLALACSRIVIQPKAKLGDFETFLQSDSSKGDLLKKSLEELAGRRSYPRLLVRSFADRELALFQVAPAKGAERVEFITKQELDDDAGRQEPRWKDARPIKPAGAYLTLDAESARKFGLADAVEDDLTGLYQLEGVEPSQVRDATGDRDWLDDLANFLRNPSTSVVLVLVGIVCLVLELKMPGVGLPGIIAAVCFVLFFWSQSQLHGQITWLAMLLFVLGLLMIGLEVFVLPGMGVLGISGIILVFGSLGLVAYGHWPRSNDEWVAFGRTVGPFGISILGGVAGAFFLARFLPSIPYANRLMLRPEGGHGDSDALDEPSGVASPDFSGLLGAVGVAATPLRPAGKVQFGDDFVDVVAEGGYIPPGARVQVVEIEGNRVVVKEV